MRARFQYKCSKEGPLYDDLRERLEGMFDAEVVEFILADRPLWNGGEYLIWLDNLSDQDLKEYCKSAMNNKKAN